MASNLTFATDVDNWCRQAEERLLAVFRMSAQDVVSEMQKPVGAGGNMPIDFGFLRASIRASNDSMPQIDPSAKGGAPAVYNPREVNLVIAGTELGQPLYIGYTAAYATYLEYGTSKMAPRAFVRLAAMQWPQIVDRNIVKAKNTVLNGFARLTKYD
ncbi:HK97 gp10 family phage protein [Tardiphaga sp.]|uniref:HK97 gp10 family phage protein n=1 Tax=Tardiphaga sp. TaxID=1926292 RepID=UPI00262DFBB6|nr:HK97 gp10 family phage protein [Tardiphaga sp.]MDB5617468.1 hypothetical protein [Tardiphaga sp.]